MQIPSYDNTQVAPSGGINAQATPDDFGAGVGAGIQRLAQGGMAAAQDLQRIGVDQQRIQNAIAQDQDTVWAYDAVGKSLQGMQTDLTNKVNSFDPNDPKFSENISNLTSDLNAQMEQQRDQLIGSARSEGAARVLAKTWSLQSRSLMSHVISEQARLSAAYTGQQVNNVYSAAENAVAANPDSYAEQTAHLSGMVAQLNVDPAKKIAFNEQGEKKLALVAGTTVAATNPAEFLGNVGVQGGRLTSSGSIKGAVPGGPQFSLPQNYGADTVHAYDAATIQKRAAQVKTPNQYDADINAAAAETGVDPQELKLSLAVESDFNPNAVGPMTKSGTAKGIAQITDANAKAAGIDPFNPQQAIRWAAKHMADTLKANNGSVTAMDNVYYSGQPTSDASMPNTQQYVANKAAVRQALGSVSTPGSDLPQVQPMTDQEISAAAPKYAWWNKLEPAQRIQLVRQAEANLGGKLAGERGTTSMALRDAGASFLAGKDYPGADNGQFALARLQTLYGPEKGQQEYDLLQYKQQVGQGMQHISTMPIAQVNTLLQTMAPQGGAEYAEKAPIYNAMLEAAARVQKEQKEDFTQHAINNGIAGAGPIDWTDNDTIVASLGQRQAVVDAGRNDFGIANPQMLSKTEAKQMADMFDKKTPPDQLTMLQQMRQATKGNDAAFSSIVRQLSPHNPMLAQAADVSMRPGTVQLDDSSAQTGAAVGQYLLEGIAINQGKTIGDGDKVARGLKLDFKQLDNAFNDQVGDAFQSNNAARSAEMKGRMLQSVQNYIAADVFHRGLDPKSMDYQRVVKRAITAVTGGVTEVQGGKLFMPWGMSEDKFDSLWHQTASKTLAAAGMTGAHADPAVYKPINLGEGRYGFLSGTQPLVDKRGNTVIADFNGAH
jgi:Skp family chaperone for outer membrane proteins